MTSYDVPSGESRMTPSDDGGFVKRGFALLGLMTILVVVVLAILFNRPEGPPPVLPADLPANPSSAGWQIRYNAAVTLARRGSDQVPWDVMAEILDEKRQLKNYAVPLPDGREAPDEAAARSTVITGLTAVRTWHGKRAERKQKSDVPAEVRVGVERLAQSPILELKVQAERTRQVLGN